MKSVPFVPASTTSVAERQLHDFQIFAGQQGFTADELEEAYLQLCGVADESLELAPEHVRLLVQCMHVLLTAQALPFNIFVQLIAEKRALEAAPAQLFALIDSLQTSDHEKDVLRSVYRRMRSGTLTLRYSCSPIEVGFRLIAPHAPVVLQVVRDQFAQIYMQALSRNLFMLGTHDESCSLEVSFEE